MRHALGWADLTAKTVGIFGAGIEGRAAIERLDGLAREIVVVDDAPSPSGDPTVMATDKGGLDALERCDVVIKSPGISAYRPEIAALEARGIPVGGQDGRIAGGARGIIYDDDLARQAVESLDGRTAFDPSPEDCLLYTSPSPRD